MKNDFQCPACGVSMWRSIERFRFTRVPEVRWRRLLQKSLRLTGILLRNGPSHQCVRGEITAGNRHKPKSDVFFDVWFNGLNQVDLKSIYCEKCGFACFSPRPDESDLDAKYRSLEQARKTEGDHRPAKSNSETADIRRRRMVSLLAPLLGKCPASILDFGGNDGHLVAPFAALGHRCHVVDYGEKTLPGVTRLGATIDQIDPHLKFDLIVCSHVLEHLADPVRVLITLAGLLVEEGKIYIEVPSEIHGAVRIEHDPVTHVNFFTPGSLGNTVRMAGLDGIEVRLERVPYDDVEIDALWIVAQRCTPDRKATLFDSDIEKHLHPGRWTLVRRYTGRLYSAVVSRLRNRALSQGVR